MARYVLGKQQIVNDLQLLNSSPFADLLSSCLKSKSSSKQTQRIHARIIKSRFCSETFILNRLIDVYGKSDFVDDAYKVFDRMPERNIFSWNAVLSTLTNAALLDEANQIFESMPVTDQCSWNSMVSGFAQHDRFDESVEFFVSMHAQDFVLNQYTYGSSLSSCAGLRNLKMGTQIHASISKSPYEGDVYMGSALIDMYSKCGNVDCAQKVFNGMNQRNVVSWNSLITCYEQNGPASEALDVFNKMMNSGIEPDEVTLASMISACASLSKLNVGREIHNRVVKFNKYRDDLVICNALVDMYAKCSRIVEARWIFDTMPIKNIITETSIISGYAKAANVETASSMFVNMTERNIVSWNALIAGYTQNGENEVALGLFRQLKQDGVFPTHYTFGNLLNACASLADLRLGQQAHTHVIKHGFRFESGPESDIFVGNSLIDMYVKCGSIEDGTRAFRDMAQRDYVSWNAIIVGFAQNGHGFETLELFKEMLASGEKPDHVTMIGLLSACSHAGLVEEGRRHFYSMTKEYGIEPMKDHFACMVDLFGRAGCLDEAKNLIETMPIEPDAVIWSSLLGACKVHGNVELGKFVAEKLMKIDPKNSGPYVLLSNMYAEKGNWGDVKRVRKIMKQNGVVKQPGCSWIELQGKVHVFMVKDRRQRQKKEIYTVLRTLTKVMKLFGYVPNVRDLEANEEGGSDLNSFEEQEVPITTEVS
ncbi:pentatricopeptide repeat-containing protein At2g13600 [Cynara cardunculus var. scolymus]|uniref:Pentatricopeptide repeat-containing protein n=1 Tax=Cynara cardunculus var. scolymus TaxID=59895 RepID=A0A103XCD9_CYNCS|nr:pentatricopeptide repeat-containing protein At2g13600 [Cynara cardunculus var. scolymus]KVH88124.1 Pentatricopeptide repeat-containing protein [Cynara cardunculus var. scolymus]